MSHGRVHDAKGVKGTHLQGTVPTKAVLDAVPDGVGTVGHIADPQPGDHEARKDQQTSKTLRFDQEKQRRGPMRDAEGDLVLPGGNRDGTGMFISRPTPQVPVEPKPALKPVVEAVKPKEKPKKAPVEPVVAPKEPEATQDTLEPEKPAEKPAEPKVAWPQGAEELAEWFTKSKMQRAKVAELEAWCPIFGIDPAEFAGDGVSVTGTMMRDLISQHVEDEYGVVL